jgi:hypothetical protein
LIDWAEAELSAAAVRVRTSRRLLRGREFMRKRMAQFCTEGQQKCVQDGWGCVLFSGQVLEEAVEEGDLGGEDFFAGGVEGEPFGAVDFRDFDFAAGAGWPLDGRGVADEVGGVEVALESPRGDEFAAELLDISERGVGAGGV